MSKVLPAASLWPPTGTTTFKLIAAATINATSVRNSETKLVGGVVKNRSATEKFFKLYDKNAAPVPAGDTPVLTFALSAGETLYLGRLLGLAGHTFKNGLAFTTTGGIADNDATAVVANDLLIDLLYA